jgi:hypothetical protein
MSDDVTKFVEYVHDFHEANDEWPTRGDYADFLGVSRRNLRGVRGAINAGLICYLPGDRLGPPEAAEQAWASLEDKRSVDTDQKGGS